MATKMWRFGWLGEEVLKVCVSTHKSFTFCEAQMFEEPIVVQTWLGLMTRSGLQIQLLVYIDLSLWLIWIVLS